jgi:glutathione S-transferase
MDLTLHGYWASTPTFKVALALAMMGLPHRFRHVDVMAGAQRDPAYLALNRFGQVPTLEIDGVPHVQSNAILLSLGARTGQFWPTDPHAQQQVREWLFWEFDSLGPGIFRPRAVKRGFFTLPQAVVEHFAAAGWRGLKTLNRHLMDRDWLVGDAPSLADIACFACVVFAGEGEAEFDLAALPALNRWQQRLLSLPGATDQPYALVPNTDRD